jgi:hypothetical protein
MRRRLIPGVAVICAGLAGLASTVGACSSGGNGSGPQDAGEGGEDAAEDQSLPPTDAQPIPPPDAPTVVPEASIHDCILTTADGGTADPVLLCSQETALLNLLTNAYTTGTGVSPGFSSQMPFTATPGHAWQDDLGLAASLGAFQCSALAYGDTMYLGMFDGVLADLGKRLAAEVVLTGSYDGELYFQLRNAAQGFTLTGSASVAAALDALADGYARTLQTTYVQTVQVAFPADGGLGLDAGATTATVIGTPASGAVAYAPAQAVMAAAALLDMAARYESSGDAGADVALWQASATGALAYLWARARDPVTGLFYQALVTSADPGHDAPGTGMFANDALLSDVQGPIVLGLARAQTAASALAVDGGSAAAPYAAQIEALVTALTTAGLFNGATTAPQGGGPAVPAAWMQGLVPSLGQTLTNQTTASNALLMGGYARGQSLGAAGAWSYEAAGAIEALDFSSPNGVAWPPNTNLVSVVTDKLGDVIQVAYLPAASRGWSWPQAFSPSGTDAGLAPDAMSYGTAAVNAMVEGATQLWYGQAAPCAY